MDILSDRERKEIEAYFIFCDGDGDGVITVKELRDALAIDLNGSVLNEGDATPLLGGEKDFLTFFEEADYDEDGRLTLDEVLRFHAERKRRGETGPVNDRSR